MAEQIIQETETNFLGDLQSVMTGKVVSCTRYSVEDAKGGAIWVQKKGDGLRQDLLGDELIKLKIDYELFDRIKEKMEKHELSIPGDCEMMVQVELSGGNRASLKALTIRSAPTPQQQPSKAQPKTQPKQ